MKTTQTKPTTSAIKAAEVLIERHADITSTGGQYSIELAACSVDQATGLPELLAVLGELIASRDANAFGVERYVSEDESMFKAAGGYYSPHASMINSDVIAKARAVLAKHNAQ